ncbi:branched-chain alpha-keto acid dehydrogenase subunit E2 [Halobacteriales archaeon SW_5_70_135]|nr:MAG: branched-chain alpha-keto acid dehydrogenase subunit E2 [Halobacteriales archaeon SW_5_70_135]
MATREFTLPDVGEGVAEGTLEAWLVSEGDQVSEDQPLAEVETDKALVDVPSPVDGTIERLHAEAGDVVPVGDVIVTFELDAGESGAGTQASSEPEAPADEAGADGSEPEPAPDPDPEPGPAEAPAGGNGTAEAAGSSSSSSGRVFAAPSTRRLARELGVDIAAVEGTGPGGRVTEADVRRAAGDEESSSSGEPATAETAATDTDDGTVTVTAGDDGAARAAERPPGDTVASPAVESANRDRTLAAPATRRVAEEESVDIDAVPAVEQRDGEPFVTADAVREYAEKQRQAQAADATALATGEGETVDTDADTDTDTVAEPELETSDASDASATEREEREPYGGVRRTIGEQMERSKYTAPHVTHHDEVDVTALVETREELKGVAEERGVRLTYVPFVMKACVAALKQFPYLNAQLDEENEEIVTKRYYNLGVATATDAGLMVPVVDGVDRKGLLEVARETNELVEQARDRRIDREKMRGGSFTVTNVGGIGGEYATPIVNYPEVAILALGEVRKKPRVVETDDGDEIRPRHVLPLSLSFDHRVVDGAMGARFTNAVMEYLRNPDLLLLE